MKITQELKPVAIFTVGELKVFDEIKKTQKQGSFKDKTYTTLHHFTSSGIVSNRTYSAKLFEMPISALLYKGEVRIAYEELGVRLYRSGFRKLTPEEVYLLATSLPVTDDTTEQLLQPLMLQVPSANKTVMVKIKVKPNTVAVFDKPIPEKLHYFTPEQVFIVARD